MLVLSRGLQESIRIDNDITIKIISIDGKQVRLGIEAPRDVSVHREEIYRKIQAALGIEQESEIDTV